MEYKEITAYELKSQVAEMYAAGKYRLVAMFANDERSFAGYFAIYCILGGNGQFTGLKALVTSPDLEFESLTPIFQVAAWYEREIHDLFGIVPVGHPDLRRLVLHENWPIGLYPLRKDFAMADDIPEDNIPYPMVSVQGEGVFEVPVGPIHAGIIEPGHFRFSQSGEHIINLDAKLFFTHRGIEKGMEGVPLTLGIYRAERVCGACSVSHGISYSQGIEAMANIKIPSHAQYCRGILAELERLYNHIGDIGNLCAGVGFALGISHGSRLKEILMRLNEKITGNRFLRGVVVPGGVTQEITLEISQEIDIVLEEVAEEFLALMSMIKDNSAFLDRVNNTGILPRQAALDLGVVGVAARASGIGMDTRRDYTYSIYNKVTFKVPIEKSGDAAARLWIREAEVEESIAIIRQLLKSIPDAKDKLRVEIPAIKPYSSGLGWSESARGCNLHWIMVGERNEIYRYFLRSASYPNWPAVTVAAPGNIIPDFPLINKSFELCYACLDR